MSNKKAKRREQFLVFVALLLFALLSPLMIAVVVAAILFYVLSALCLYVAVWFCWCRRGRSVLFVYSDSPIWREYVEERILPRLGERAVVLNWSQRKRWRGTLPVLVFRFFGGSRDFNPLAVVFRPLRFARRFRFHEPFREYKHGKTESLARMERELFELVDEVQGPGGMN